jgi:hypothetical protein
MLYCIDKDVSMVIIMVLFLVRRYHILIVEDIFVLSCIMYTLCIFHVNLSSILKVVLICLCKV